MAAAQDQYEQLLNLTGCFASPPDSVSERGVAATSLSTVSSESQQPTSLSRNITAELRCLQALDLSVLLRHADHAGLYSDSLDSSRYAPVIDGTELLASPLYLSHFTKNERAIFASLLNNGSPLLLNLFITECGRMDRSMLEAGQGVATVPVLMGCNVSATQSGRRSLLCCALPIDVGSLTLAA